MPDVAELWENALPEVKDSVTGAGVWAALNSSVPIALEEGVFVLGVPSAQNELAGHLRLPLTRKTIEDKIAARLNQRVQLEVIDGTTAADWETEKKREQEKKRLQARAAERAREEHKARSSWQGVYDQLSRMYSATENRSLPQNRARFFMQAVDVVAEALTETPVTDELAERNYARCIERIAQYTELPSALVALKVLEKTFHG